MNYRSLPHNLGYAWDSGTLHSLRNMLPMHVTMSSPPNDLRNVSDDRINLQDIRHSRTELRYETTMDGDVAFVHPSTSYEDSIDRSKTPTHSHFKPQDWQARSPIGDSKESDHELRNPSSPPKEERRRPRHERNLSAQFFESTSLSDREPDMFKDEGDALTGRKHRRMFSGGVSYPPQAHRRMNSIGNSHAVQRQHHHRVNSAGLDILSAAVAVTKDELEGATGGPIPVAPWDPPHQQERPSIGQVSTGSFEQPYSAHHVGMNPPPQRRADSHPHRQRYMQQQPPPPSSGPYHSHYQGYHPHHSYPYYQQVGYPAPPNHSPPPHEYPEQYSQRHGMYRSYPSQEPHPGANRSSQGRNTSPTPPEWSRHSSTQGSQTFVTAMAVGTGNRTMHASSTLKNAGTNTEERPPSEVRHHRKMSSLTSLGTILGSSVFPGNATEPVPKGRHHRQTSSSVSFLQGIDVGLEGNDAVFLRNLQASNSLNPHYGTSIPEGLSDHDDDPDSKSSMHGSRLASGGTSKRVRRKCTVANCPNRVVQGGRCITHGAKRKTCRHPGCPKNVKKAGLCSTHGPARKRCEAPGCEKVAVQAGRCIAHGAKKKLCVVENCTKQAILCGMCKKHHDRSSADGRRGDSTAESDSSQQYCQEVPPVPRVKPGHTRGLSIFQEISADTVQHILEDTTTPTGTISAEQETQPRSSAW
jgi:hypothetical protein